MKRLFLSITVLAFALCTLCSYAQDTVELSKGAFIQVYAKKNLSTATLQEGDRVYFVSPADVWIEETNVIPKNSVFVGYVNMLKMPVKGINAAFGMKITHIVLPTGETRNFEGRVTNGTSDIFGGTLTPPVSYNKMAHPYLSRWHWSGTTQWVPSGDYEYGRHVAITPSMKIFVELDEPYTTEKRY